MVLPWASRTTLFCVQETRSDHVIAYVVSMSVKAYSNNNMNNELQLIQEVSHISSKVLKMMLVSLTMFTGL